MDVPLYKAAQEHSGSSELWVAWENLVFNAAFSLLDLEETFHSPWWAPWVSAEPVGSTVLNTVSEDLDGVTTSNIWGGWWVDTWLVVEEVSVDGESTFDWTVLNDFRLDLFNTLGLSDWVFFAGESLNCWSILAGFGAFWSWTGASFVWDARIEGSTVLSKVFPSHIHVSTTATVVVGVAWD